MTIHSPHLPPNSPFLPHFPLFFLLLSSYLNPPLNFSPLLLSTPLLFFHPFPLLFFFSLPSVFLFLSSTFISLYIPFLSPTFLWLPFLISIHHLSRPPFPSLLSFCPFPLCSPATLLFPPATLLFPAATLLFPHCFFFSPPPFSSLLHLIPPPLLPYCPFLHGSLPSPPLLSSFLITLSHSLMNLNYSTRSVHI